MNTVSSKGQKIDDWEARDALKTLIRAREIQKNPAMMAAVKKAAAARLDEMNVLREMAGHKESK